MIKLPEPALWIDTATHPHEIRYTPDVYCKDNPHYTKAQLKQAVRDALNLAADTCESTLYVEGDGTVSVYGPKTDANVEIRKCLDAIRALIKEIEA